MKIFKIHSARRGARFTGGLLALFFLAASAFAQWPEHHQPGRYLFIFETSPTVKRSLPSVEKTLAAIFTNGLSGELRAGDEIGVWTVDNQLHTGQFPLSVWVPADAATFPARLKAFFEKQWFRHTGDLALLDASLNRVAENSERLTVFIFCDGQSGISGTPFDDGVRAVFKESATGQKKLHQPFIVVLRTQHGKYAACAVTLSPNRLNVPDFPPLPVKPAPVVVPVVVAPAPVVKPLPPVVVPSLIMVGTNIGANSAPALPIPEKPVVNPPSVPDSILAEKREVKPAPAPEKIAPPPNIVVVAVKTNPVLPSAKISTRTNLPAVVSATPAPADRRAIFLFSIGGVALGAVVVLVIILVARSRRQHGSLITSSMNQPRSRRQK